MSSCVEFYLECKKAGIKPILGIRHKDKICIAKNKDGYKKLLNLCYDINLGIDINWNVWQNDNIYILDKDSDKIDLPTPRFFKDKKICFDIAYATKNHSKIDQIQENLKSFQNDWFGNHDSSKIKETEKLADSIEEYDITGKPTLPLFDGRDDNSALFRKLSEKQLNLEFPDNPIYRARLELELSVLQGAKLENYFLILKDIMDWARSQGYLLGPGRGSSGGCLVSYLLNITQVDPIKYDLVFERFYNAGRNTDDYIALADIDIDVPQRSRKNIIDYIIKRYGVERVGKIATFQTYMGRSALSAVLRATSNIGFTELKNITQHIKDKAAISDELQLMVDGGQEKSVILWGLINEPQKFENYCQIKDGQLIGDYADEFRIAIDLEETKCALSEHAAGIVISRDKLRDCCPMIKNHDYLICGPEMEELEAISLQKLDLLGLKTLDVLEDI